MSDHEGPKLPTSQDIAYQYAVVESQLKELSNHVHVTLTNELAKAGLPVLSIEGRLKTFNSLLGKIRDKEKPGLDQVNDLVGVRVLTLFDSDIDRVCAVIERIFDFEKDDQRIKSSPDAFNYSAVHYQVQIKPQDWQDISRIHDKEFNGLDLYKINSLAKSKLTAEIQVRTLLQDVWAQFSHPIYKERCDHPDDHEASEIPFGLKRGMSRLSAFLEVADQELDRLKIIRSCFLESRMENLYLREVNSESVSELLAVRYPDLPTGNSIDSILSVIDRVRYLRIRDIADLLDSAKSKLSEWTSLVGRKPASNVLFAALMFCDKEFQKSLPLNVVEPFFHDQAVARRRKELGY